MRKGDRATDPAVPRIFRVTVQVSGLDAGVAFYSRLLGIPGRGVGGGRHYFDCGGVLLALVDVSRAGAQPQPVPKAIYFSVRDLEGIHQRALELGCLSAGDVHDERGGAIAKRPWGERSFYVTDPFGNQISFVDEQTLFTGAESGDPKPR